MKEELISLETAKLAKEKGFNVITNSHWQRDYGDLENGNYPPLDSFTFYENIPYRVSKTVDLVPAPTQSLLQKWLREEHYIHIDLTFDDNVWNINIGTFSFPDWCADDSFRLEEKESQNESIVAYTEALEKGLYEALKII